MAALLKDGIKVGNQTYSDSVTFSQNNTYAIRVIAYKLPLGRFPATSGDVLAFYNDRGKRADLIVIFRGIRQDEDGSVTILWKELSRKKARSISFFVHFENEKVGDFRTPTVRK